jgi:hypothetical protein
LPTLKLDNAPKLFFFKQLMPKAQTRIKAWFETEAWLVPGDEHDSEASFVAHHAPVTFYACAGMDG